MGMRRRGLPISSNAISSDDARVIATAPLTNPADSAGFLVLGMHRSGTSVLARLLAAAGASPGERLVPGSHGNEEGHWEDAFAVETNERLLAALGRRWDDLRPLPRDWLQSEAAAAARAQIRDYVRSDLSRHALWAIKDPRMCLFAELWLQAFADAGSRPSVLLLGRHPREIAASLAARDGMAHGKAMLLWLRHVLDAERASRGLPRAFLAYDMLLADPDAAMRRISQLPGGQRLRPGANAGDSVVRPDRRHHRHEDAAALPDPVAAAWRAHLAAVDGRDETAAFDRAGEALSRADVLYAPVLQELDREQSVLWNRTARAEAALARTTHNLAAVPETLVQLRETLDAHRGQVVDAIETRHHQALDALGEHAAGLIDLHRSNTAALEHLSRSVMGELQQARSRIAVLQHDSDLLQQVRTSWSWRITRPFRVLRRLLAGGKQARTERRKLAAALSGGGHSRSIEVTAAASANLADSPQAAPAAAEAGRPDVFVWAVIDWHFRIQRPQHLASALATAGHRVFYLSNNLVDSPTPGFRAEALDASGRLFQVNLHAAGAPEIYHGAPGARTAADLRRSMGELMQWADSDGGLCILQHPFWLDVANAMPGAALLYDCMDHHAGFENNAACVLEAEDRLTRDADLLVVTSEWLDRKLADANPNRALIRNATEYAHFSDRPRRVYRDPKGRRVIGYYGAIAEWFDLALVRAIAERYTDCKLLLVGHDSIGAAARLAGLDNVEFTGEVAYDELPYYLHGFDVALLPFQVIELTLATNPVKVYEYLSAGKPVVAVDLPEIAQFGDLVHRAADPAAFVDAVALALAEAGEGAAARVEARKAFARQQTWEHRARQLDEAIAALPAPRVSVVVLAYNNLELTRACLESIEAYSHWPNLEVIVVDNASSDGTREFLRDWERGGAGRKAILNDDNLGFAAGNNLGLAAASGDYLVLLNNDTYVTPHWVRTLVNHLRRNPGLGIVGPVTNNIGNEAKIDIRYDDMRGMRAAAAAHTRRNAGRLLPIRTVAFFCVAMPRSTYDVVGPLDPAFGIGFFEDDDYCRRVESAGLGIACAEDAFVHHHLSASFDKLKAEARQQLFLKNKAIYEAKWGEWQPHRYRDQAPATDAG
jgi:GT2 family glycosyltransferase/glycosyltransferase involved in cell wall biosynthesis